MKDKKTLKKHYFMLIGILLLVTVICVAFYNLYNEIGSNKISKSVLLTDSNEILIDDLNSATIDIESDTFLLISYTNDAKTYKMEKNVKKYLTKLDLLNNLLYLDCTKYLDDDSLITNINSKLNLTDKQIEKLPAVVLYKNGEVTSVIDSKNHDLDSTDFEYLVEAYEIAE